MSLEVDNHILNDFYKRLDTEEREKVLKLGMQMYYNRNIFQDIDNPGKELLQWQNCYMIHTDMNKKFDPPTLLSSVDDISLQYHYLCDDEANQYVEQNAKKLAFPLDQSILHFL